MMISIKNKNNSNCTVENNNIMRKNEEKDRAMWYSDTYY